MKKFSFFSSNQAHGGCDHLYTCYVCIKKGKSLLLFVSVSIVSLFFSLYNLIVLMGQKISSHNFWEIVEGSNFNKSRIFVGLKWNVRNLNCWDELFTSFINIIKTLILGIPDDEIRNFLIFHNNLLMGCIYWNELWDLWSNFDRICSVMWENWWKIAITIDFMWKSIFNNFKFITVFEILNFFTTFTLSNSNF